MPTASRSDTLNSPTYCLTGSERTTGELASRLERPADLHEVRLDLLDDLGEDTYTLIAQHGPRLIATCRTPFEGGGFEGSEGDRLAVLKRASRTGVAWLDLELFLFEQGATARLDLDRLTAPPRLIASLHDFAGGPGSIERLASRFEER